MKVVHLAAEIAGQPALLCRGLRALGVDARSIAFGPGPMGHRADHQFEATGVVGWLDRLAAWRRFGWRADILHIHFGRTFLPFMADLHGAGARGTRLVFHFHGCDVRPRRQTLARHPLAACSECEPFCKPWKQVRLRRWASCRGSLTLVSTPDLLEVVPGAEHLPVAVDDGAWEARRQLVQASAEFEVLHAPSDPLIKGTRHVEAAVRQAARLRPSIRLRLVQGFDADAAAARFAGADCAVDQLHMGWHGLFAVEAMLLGLPVLVYIRPELRERARDLPAVAVTAGTLAGTLVDLHDRPARCKELAYRGPDYARRVHGLGAVAERLKRLYEERVLGVA